MSAFGLLSIDCVGSVQLLCVLDRHNIVYIRYIVSIVRTFRYLLVLGESRPHQADRSVVVGIEVHQMRIVILV